MWLFVPHSMLKNTGLSSSFPAMGFMLGAFYWLFRWTFENGCGLDRVVILYIIIGNYLK